MKRRFLPWWAALLRIPTGITVWTYMHAAYRVRGWGRLPPSHTCSLIVANHQIEIDLMELAAGFYLSGGPRSPVLLVGARLMREPGFLAIRIRWLWRLLHGATLDWLFDGLGLLPIENELSSRSIARWAWAVQRLHGELPLERIFKPSALERFGFSGLQSGDLFKARYFQRAQSVYVRVSELRQPYAQEQLDATRAFVEEDLERIQGSLQSGATFFLTPEGDYSHDGAMLPFRAIWQALSPLAKSIYLIGISFDPFAPGLRLSQLYRYRDLHNREDVIHELRASRPVTVSALIATWLISGVKAFTVLEAAAAVESQIALLPANLFVDPEFAADPNRFVRGALQKMLRLGILAQHGDGYVLSDVRRHPSFPGVEDIVAFQARFHAQTLAGASFLADRQNANGDISASAGR